MAAWIVTLKSRSKHLLEVQLVLVLHKDQSFLEALDHLVGLHLLEVHQEVQEDLADLLHRRCLKLALLARYLLLVPDHQMDPEALEDQVGPVGLLCRLTPVGLEVLELLEVQQSLAALEDQVGLWDQDHLQDLWSLGTEELSLLYLSLIHI